MCEPLIQAQMYKVNEFSIKGMPSDKLHIILLLELTRSLMKSVTFVLYHIGTTTLLLARANIPTYPKLLL